MSTVGRNSVTMLAVDRSRMGGGKATAPSQVAEYNQSRLVTLVNLSSWKGFK
jgi:hypothetical protein